MGRHGEIRRVERSRFRQPSIPVLL
jgi:hypothetical protein